MKENNIDNIFSNKLRNFEKIPPEDIWTSISGNLRKQKSRSLYLLAWKIAAGIAILITTGIGWYFINEKIDTGRDIIAEKLTERELKITEENELPVNKPDVDANQFNSETGISIENVPYLKKDIDKNAEPDLTELRLKSDEKQKTASSFSELKTNDQSRPAYSILYAFPGQVAPPLPSKDKITRKKTKRTVTWEMLTSDVSDEEQTSMDENRNWQIAAMGAPEYSYRTVKDGVMASSAYFNNSENAKISYSGGIQVGYQLSKKLNLQSGIIYSRSGIEINNLNAAGAVALAEYFNSPLIQNQISIVNTGNSMGIISAENPNLDFMSYNSTSEEFKRDNQFAVDITGSQNITQIDAELVQYFDFIELPLNLRYRLYDGKINLNVLGGLSSNVLVGNKVIIKSDDEKWESGRTENIRTFNYSGNIGFSLDYEINDQFLLLFEPRYKYYLRSINHEGFLDARPYMIGVFTGIRYRF